MPAAPDRVLAVRLGAIGDVVNALVFATALKDAQPGIRIGWVVHALAAPLVLGHPSVDRTHVWKRGGGWRELRRLLREIRAERYELAVDLQRIQKSALVARLSGAPRVLGYDRARAKELSWVWTKERIPARPPARAMVLHYREFAEHLGAPPGEPRHLFPHDNAAEARAEALARELGGAFVLINVGASKPANRWPPERFGELARRLQEELGVRACFTGGPLDRAAADAARARAGADVRDLVGATTLLELVALARRARLFIGCDTGPMHVAAAVKTPVVALFGPAEPARTGPYGEGHVVVRVPPAGPGRARMEDITVEHVLAAARDRLAGVALEKD